MAVRRVYLLQVIFLQMAQLAAAAAAGIARVLELGSRVLVVELVELVDQVEVVLQAALPVEVADLLVEQAERKQVIWVQPAVAVQALLVV